LVIDSHGCVARHGTGTGIPKDPISDQEVSHVYLTSLIPLLPDKLLPSHWVGNSI
jgi:hypothetical protein